MSRQEFAHPTEQKRMSVGKDHVFGNFIQVWDTSEYNEPDGDNIIIDRDNLSWSQIQKIITKYGFTQVVGVDI